MDELNSDFEKQKVMYELVPVHDFTVAERKGFEPLIPCGIRALQARALGQTTQPLRAILIGRESYFTINNTMREEKI